MGQPGRTAAARAPARLRGHRGGRAARRGAALPAARRRGGRSERRARRRGCARGDGARGRAGERRPAARAGRCDPRRPGPRDRLRTCRARRPSCASWRRRTTIRSSPGASSARPCWPLRRSRRSRSSAAPARGTTRLLVLALACQASISIVQWGLGVIAPDLQERYDLSAASLGALINATAFGNAVALIAAGVIVDRSGPRKPLLYAGSAVRPAADRRRAAHESGRARHRALRERRRRRARRRRRRLSRSSTASRRSGAGSRSACGRCPSPSAG